MNKLIKTTVAVAATGVLGLGLYTNTASADSYKSQLKHKGELTIGLEGTYAPFSYKDKSGKLVGYDVEVAKAVAKEMGLKPVFVQTKFDSLVSGLDSNKYDVVYNDMGKTKQREKHYAFGGDYLKSQAVIIVKKDSDIHKVSQLKGKKAAQTTSSNYGQAALKAKANIVSAPGFAESLDLVNSGKADATLNAEDAWGVYKKQHPKTDLKAIPTKDLDSSNAAPMLNKDDKQLAKRITKAQDKLKKDGTLTKLSKKYFDKDLSGSKSVKKDHDDKK
ncbi:cystine transport system substrate-binding protein [Weissella uvarum]|uniref:transporter substrate-binding domain-containing protein n=1 Tax=Weissella uvarum TaxID=1479233 RepID=UPI001961E3EA|nr:transporter substrate-binding domain-containing protein [Weissella uvarum]MBM7616916.1 cystine transport system substrate-binding protein [Weissella uvarum]MCM0594633.1 transporter substrate-binding domain-containing protein [Weissella uvarum]